MTSTLVLVHMAVSSRRNYYRGRRALPPVAQIGTSATHNACIERQGALRLIEDEPKPPMPRTGMVWTVTLVVASVSLVAVTCFGIGIVAEREWFRVGSFGAADGDQAPDSAAAFPQLGEIRALIDDQYYFRPASPTALSEFQAELERDAVSGMATAAAAATPVTAVDDYLQRLEYGAIQGVADGLPDDYSVFLEPVAQAPVAEQMAGEYEGIGVWVDYPEGAPTIVGTFPESPAAEAGLLSGDVIEAADGHPLIGLTPDDTLLFIRGPEGTSVRLTIRRPGQPETFDVDVERRPVTTPVVSYHLEGDQRIAWIHISIFNDKTTGQLDEALKRAKDDQVEGIVLDLRQNVGGWVTSAREAVGRFVPADKGPALYEDDEAAVDDDLISESILNGGEETFETPMIVLVDGGTASAAEIVAGALRVYGRAWLVGAPTFGKGLVQTVHDFQDGSSLRLTAAEWLTPDKQPIPADGLKPDILVEIAPDAVDSQDAQLQRAIDLLLEGTS